MDSTHATPSVASSVKKSLELAEVVEETAIMQEAYECSLRVNEMNRLVMESGVYATDANGRTTFINPAAMRMTGGRKATNNRPMNPVKRPVALLSHL